MATCIFNNRHIANMHKKKTIFIIQIFTKTRWVQNEFIHPISISVITEAVLSMLKESAPKIVRLYGKKLEKSDFPILGRDARSKRQVDRKTDEELKEISMHNIIRKEGKEYAETLREYDSFFRSLSEDELQSDRKKHKTYLKNMQSYHQCLTNATICELQNYEAVFCTTSVATKGQIFTNKNVYQVIIDEAGMCTEPETIAAIVALAAKQVVLIGDHQQLRPVVNCLEAGKLGLEKSMFEQYAELSEDPELSRFIKFTTLTTQYRMVSGFFSTSPQI